MSGRKLALVGMGKMGRVLEQLAPERGWDVVAQIGAGSNRDGAGITRAALAGADVAIDFTAPNAAVANVRAAVTAECPIVVGTTGWHGELPALAEWVARHQGALLTGANFSLGVNAFEQIVALASRLLGEEGCTVRYGADPPRRGGPRVAARDPDHERTHRLGARHARATVRCAVRDRGADARRARSAGVRRRCPRGRGMADRANRRLHDA